MTIETYTAFAGTQRLASGELQQIAVLAKAASNRGEAVLAFADRDGQQIDLNLGGDAAAVAARYAQRTAAEASPPPAERRRRGRPRLGVVAREVTLLPRHWEWLAAQPGGASITLRKLIEQARRDRAGGDRRRQAQEAAYRVMAALAGDLEGFEEAARALFASDQAAFHRQLQPWPGDVRDYLAALAAAAFDPAQDGDARRSPIP